MGSMQCNVEFGYQLSICSRIKENHGNTLSNWPVAGPSGCRLVAVLTVQFVLHRKHIPSP
jgi:hypothetical protein